MEGRLLQPLGISFIVAIFTSLFVAVTLTPVLSSYLLTDQKRLAKQAEGSFIERSLSKAYKKMLTRILKLPQLPVVAALLLFVVSIWLMTGLGRSFLPEFNEGSLVISVITPPGTALEESNRTARLVEDILLEILK